MHHPYRGSPGPDEKPAPPQPRVPPSYRGSGNYKTKRGFRFFPKPGLVRPEPSRPCAELRRKRTRFPLPARFRRPRILKKIKEMGPCHRPRWCGHRGGGHRRLERDLPPIRDLFAITDSIGDSSRNKTLGASVPSWKGGNRVHRKQTGFHYGPLTAQLLLPFGPGNCVHMANSISGGKGERAWTRS
jgi:hypothetical protein